MADWTELEQRFYRFCQDRWFSVDRRLLAVFRMMLAVILLVDVLRRLPIATIYYSDDGVFSSHMARQLPLDDFAPSLFLLLKTPAQAQAGMVILALIYLGYLVGYRTKLMQLLAFVGYVSLNSRNLLVTNRGHLELATMLMWTLFLPLGERLSLDALARARRGDRRPPRRHHGLAVLAITLQLAAIYLLNAVQKHGAPWEDGSAVHYTLWQNRIATDIGAWLRSNQPGWLSPLATKFTLWGEALAALLVISPWARRSCRTLLMVYALLLHGGIALTINVWPHSLTILTAHVLLVPDWTVKRVARMPLARGLAAFSADRLFGWIAPAAPRRKPPWPGERVLVYAREGATMAMLVAVALQITRDNAAVPPALRVENLGFIEPLIAVPRLRQPWSMFAEAPVTDGTIVVDATTAAGRRIDPLTGTEPDFDAPLHGPWHLSQLDCDYFLRIQRPQSARYRPALARYLERWQELEGRAASDALTSFSVYWVTNDSPPPGETLPTGIRKHLLVRGP
jgi:hypothetical protein